MGWFEQQIEKRRQTDEQLLEQSFANIASIIMGEDSAQKFLDDRIISENAIGDILKAFHYKPVEIPDSIKGFDDQLEYSLRPYGLMCRNIELPEHWYVDAYGPILAFTKKDNIPVALIPGVVSGYFFKDPDTGARIKINSRSASLFKLEAYCFYRPLPLKKLKIADLLLYMRSCISSKDISGIVIATIIATMVGALMPRLSKVLTGPVISGGRTDALIAIGISIVSITFSMQMFGSI